MNEYEYTQKLTELYSNMEKQRPLCNEHKGNADWCRCLMCEIDSLRLRNKQLVNANSELKIQMYHIYKVMKDAYKYDHITVLTSEDNDFNENRSYYYRPVDYIGTESYNKSNGVVIAIAHPDLWVDIV